MLNNLLCVDTIDHVVDNSDDQMQRALVHFKNGQTLSIIRGEFSYGGNKGLFEIMPDDPKIFDEEDQGDTVRGYLTQERVAYYINKIGAL